MTVPRIEEIISRVEAGLPLNGYEDDLLILLRRPFYSGTERLHAWRHLRQLEQAHGIVDKYMTAHRGKGDQRDHDLHPATLVGLADALASAYAAVVGRFIAFAEQSTKAQIILVDKAFSPDMRPGAINRVEPDPVVKDIYLRDFLRSWWRRLTRWWVP